MNSPDSPDEDAYFYGEFYGPKLSRLLADAEILVVESPEGSGIELVVPMILERKCTVCVCNEDAKKTFSSYVRMSGARNINIDTNRNFLNRLVKGGSMKDTGNVLVMNANTNDPDVFSILRIRNIMSIEGKNIPRILLMARNLPLYIQHPGMVYYKVPDPRDVTVIYENINLENDGDVLDFIISSHQNGTNTLVYCESPEQAKKFFSMNRSGKKIVNSCMGMRDKEILSLHDEKDSIILTTSEYDPSVMCQIRTVIDYPMTEKNVCTYTGGSRKRLERISEEDSMTRLHRASRSPLGICYRLYPKSLRKYMGKDLCATSGYVEAQVLRWEFNGKTLSSELYKNDRDEICALTGFGLSVSGVLNHWISDGLEPYACLVACALMDSYVDPVFMYPLAIPGMNPIDHKVAMGEHYRNLSIKFAGRDVLETLCKLWTSLNGGMIPSYYSIKNLSQEMGINERYLIEVRDIVAKVLPQLPVRTFDVTPMNVIDRIRDYFAVEFGTLIERSESRIGGYAYTDSLGNYYELDNLFPVNSRNTTSISVISSEDGRKFGGDAIETVGEFESESSGGEMVRVSVWISREETFVARPKKFLSYRGEMISF